MNCLVVEDDRAEISGYLSQLRANGWDCERVTTFSEGYRALAEREKKLDMLVIDIMLPWGTAVDETVKHRFDWKRAGLYLIYAVRGRRNKDLLEIARCSALPCAFARRWKDVPVIVLTKVSETVEHDIEKLRRVFVVAKGGGMRPRDFPDFVSSLFVQ